MTRSHVERLGEFREILVATRREGVRNVHHTRDAMRASGFQIGDSDGSKVITTASKEYGYRSEPPHEFEAFVLKGLDLSDVPDGSAVEFGL